MRRRAPCKADYFRAADLATRAPGEDGDAVAAFKDLAARYEAGGVSLPPVATRWQTYLAARTLSQ